MKGGLPGRKTGVDAAAGVAGAAATGGVGVDAGDSREEATPASTHEVGTDGKCIDTR